MIEIIPYGFVERVRQDSPNGDRQESQEGNPEDHEEATDSKNGADKDPWEGFSVVKLILGLLYSMLQR
jgi:hypothetical protein